MFLLHSLCVSVSPYPSKLLNFFIFILRLGGMNLGPQMMQASYLCLVLPQNKLFSESSLCIERHLDVVVNFIEVHISVALEFCIDEVFIEFW